jgi:hypothetical protein
MWLTNAPPISVGVSDTNGALAQALGQNYAYRNGTDNTNSAPWTAIRGYKLVFNNSGTTLAAGAAVVMQSTTGALNGYVTTTTTANDPTFIGIVPYEFGTATVAAASYFLVQTVGAGRPQLALTTTLNTLSAALGTATTAGYMQPLVGTASGTAAATLNDVMAYILASGGRATNTAAVTAAGLHGYADLRMRGG